MPIRKKTTANQTADTVNAMANATVPTEQELRNYYRAKYLKTHFSPANPVKVQAVKAVFVGKDDVKAEPNFNGLGDRTDYGLTWRTVQWKDAKSTLEVSSASSKLTGEMDILNSYWGWVGPIDPEYNLLEPYTLLDTEAYFNQSLKRKHSLMFRNGIKFVGENQRFVEYAERRANQISYVMNVSWLSFLKDIVWNLLVCSNCIVLKIRDEKASGGKANEKNGNKVPIAAYTIVPPHSIYPCLDGKGKISHWRRFFKNGRPYRDYPVEDIIHFKWDVKPGHIFGTPRTIAVVDDIYALRRLEENAELLLVHHLFPMVHVKVGNKEAPCEYFPEGGSEIDYIRSQIMGMPKEGVFVTDERVDLDIKGANGQGVSPDRLIEHYKKRVYIGLGVSGIDLGEADTANRATADNVSQNLKDQVKSDLDTFVDQVRMMMLKDWFQESPTNLSVQNAVADVKLEFHEIDIDGQIKQETHAVNLWNNHAIAQDELRKRLKQKAFDKDSEKQTHFYKHEVELVNLQQRHEREMAKVKAEAAPAPAKKKSPSASKGKKAIATKVQPENQHGKNLDPHKARSSSIKLSLYDTLIESLNTLPKEDQEVADEAWRGCVKDALEVFLPDRSPEEKQVLLDVISHQRNPDLIFAMIDSAV